ncbi:MAG TPA: hypothetical protein VGO56_05600 [Pyrinomonadaceae bacterium]|jgi:hypothetical protein|nr:hypothetical protein [Pyrinomonadaceae bacterium]
MTKFLQSVLVLLAICGVHFQARSQTEPLVAKWVKEDIDGVRSILELLPFEKQNINVVKAKLSKDWQVEETDLGFGATYLELGKGRGYSKDYVNALIYEGRVVQYEAGVESYSSEWAQIKDRVIDRWKKGRGPLAVEEEHALVFRRALEPVLAEYRTRVSAGLGPLTDADVPKELIKSYATLTSPMNNSTISGTDQDDDIRALMQAKRADLLKNVLRGYNPGARVLAAVALLELEKVGTSLTASERDTIGVVLDLDISLHACVFDMCSDSTAREALQWFDSGLAWPRPRIAKAKKTH